MLQIFLWVHLNEVWALFMHYLCQGTHHHVRKCRFCVNFQTCNSVFDWKYEKWINRAKDARNTRLYIRVGGKHLLNTISNFSAKFWSFGGILGWFSKTAPQGGATEKSEKWVKIGEIDGFQIFEKNSKKFRLSAFDWCGFIGCALLQSPKSRKSFTPCTQNAGIGFPKFQVFSI